MAIIFDKPDAIKIANNICDNLNLSLDEKNKKILSKFLFKNPDLALTISKEITTIPSKNKLEAWRQKNDLYIHLEILSRQITEEHLQQILKNVVEQKKKANTLALTTTDPLEVLKAFLAPGKRTYTSLLPTAVASKELSAKTFGHIHTETILENSSLAGNFTKDVIAYFHAFLQDYHPPFENSVEFQNFKKAIELEHQFFQEIGSVLTAEHYTKTLTKFINNLSPSEFFLIESGWTGHSMQMLIQKKKSDASGKELFDVLLFNLGFGSEEWHINGSNQEIALTQSYFLKENVSKASLISGYFPKAHFELQYYTHEIADPLTKDDDDEQAKPTDFSSTDLYSLCTYQLDGTVSQNIDQKNFLRYQLGPICTFVSLVAAGNYFMKKPEFSRVYFDISLHSLLAFYAEAKDTLIAQEDLQLMRHAGVSFANLVYESFNANVIGQTELSVMYDTLTEYFEFLGEKEIELQKAGSFNSELPKVPKNTIKNPKYSFFEETEALKKSIKRFPSPLKVDPQFLSSPTDIISKLAEVNRYIKTCQKAGVDASYSPKLVWKITTSLFRSLPLLNERNSPWANFEAKQAKETISLLHAILENNIDVLGESKTRNTVKKQLCLYFFQGVLIAHELSKKIPELSGMVGVLPIAYFANNYLASIHLITTQGHCTYYNPFDRKIAFNALNYYRTLPTKDLPQLFIVSNSPERNTAPVSCSNIPKLDADTFKKWLDSDKAPAEATAVFSYLENPVIQKNLLKTYPHLKTKNSQTRFCYLLCDVEGKILPSFHYAYRDMAMQLRFLSASLSLTEEDSDEDSEESIEMKTDDPKFFTFEESDQHISFKINYSVGENEEEDSSSQKICQLGYDPSKLESLENEVSKILELSRQSEHVDKDEAFILSPQFDTFIKKFAFTVTSNEDIKEFWDVITLGNRDNRIFPTETQPLKVLAYFKANKHKLNDPFLREIFFLLLFENTFLENTLWSSPTFGNILLDFINERIHYSFEEKNLNALSYILQIGRIAENILLVSRGNATAHYSNYAAWILKVLSLKDLTISQKKEFNKIFLAEFIANSSLHNDPDMIKTAINAYFSYASQGDEEDDRSDFFCSEYIKLNLSLAYCTLEPFVTEWLSKNETANDLCNAIAKNIYPQMPEGMQWDCSSYPLCVSSDKAYSINFYLGQCFKGDKIAVVLEKKFFDNTLERKLFDKPFYQADMDKHGSYYVPIHGKQIIIQNNSSFLKYFLQEDKTVYSLLSKWDAIDLFKLDIASPFRAYLEEKTLWVRKIDDNTVELSLRNNELRTTHLFFGKKQGNDWTIENVVLVKENRERLELVPQREVSQLLKGTYPSTLLSLCVVWKDASQNLSQLDIPVMALSFSLEKRDQHVIAHCNQFPGFFISHPQSIRGIGFHPHIVILENEKGEKKALLIKGEIKPAHKGAFGAGYEIEKKETPNNKPQNYYIYEINPIRELTTKDKELKLYWAYNLLALKKYDEAYAILQKMAPRFTKYTSEEAKILETIAHATVEWKDSTSGATAIGLFAMLQYIRSLNGDNIDETNRYYLNALYGKYARRIIYAPTFKLKDTDIDYVDSLLGIKSFPVVSQSYFQPAPDNLDFGRTHLLLANARRPSRCTLDDFIGLYKNMAPLLNGKAVAPPGLITRPAKYIQRHFLYFYEKAKNGNREILSDIVFARNSENKTKPFYLELLLTVYKHPDRFPTPEELLECFQKKDVEIFKQIIIIPYDELKTKTLIQAAHHIQQQHIPSLPPADPSSSSAMDIERSTSKRKLEDVDTKSDVRKLKKAKIAAPGMVWVPFLNDSEVKKTFSLAPRKSESLTPEQLADALETADVNIIPKESARLKEEINAYWTSPDREKPWQIIPEDSLEKISLQVSLLKTEMRKRFNVAHKQLMDDIKNLPSELQDAVLIGVQRQAKIYKEPTLEELTIFVARENNRFLRHLPPSFKDKEREIRRKCIEVQSQQIRIQQLERAEDSLKELKKLSSQGVQEDDIAYRHASEKLHYELTRVPPYNPYTHPHLLCLEVLDSTGIYDWQHNDIDRIVNPQAGDSKNIVLQKNMGSGKSAIYRRLLAFLLARDGQVPFIIVHSSLEGSSKKIIEEQSGVFEQFSDTFDFSRNHQSIAKLKEVFQQLKDAQEEEGFFVVTDTTLYELKQCYKENLLLFLQQSSSSPEVEEQLQLHIAIEKFMRTYCPSIWDEFDLLANIRFESIYTMGEPVDLDTSHREIVADIFQCIYADKELAEIFKAKNFTEEDYHTDLKNRIIQKYLNSSSESRLLLKNHVDDVTLEKFLQADKDTEKTVENLSLDINVRMLLHILHEEFNTLFHLTVSKKHDVDYMESPNVNKVFPCPGLACKVPNLTADFGFIYALLNYTMHQLIFVGVTSKMLYKLISGMQKAASSDLDQDPTMRLEKTKGYQDFIELCGDNFDIPFFQITEVHLEPLAAKLPRDIDFLCTFAKRFIFPFASYFVDTIVSPNYSILRLFPRIIGLTGTPWDHATYLEDIKTIFDPSVTAKATGLLIKNSEVFEIDDIEEDENGPENTIKAMVKIGNTHPNAPFDDWIDADAFLKIGNLLDGAKLLLKHLPPQKKGVVFFHNNVEMVLERGSDTPIPIEKCKLPLEERHILYDDWHTTGANFKSPPDSCGYLTVGKMTRRKLEQSFGRKRENHLRQKVVLIIKRSYAIYVRKLLQLPAGTVIKPKHILKVCQYITETEINERLVSSAEKKLDNEIEESIFNAINEYDGNQLPLLKESKNSLTTLLLKKTKDAPHKTMGPVNQESNHVIYFQDHIQKLLKKCISLSDNPLFATLTPMYLETSLNDTINNCIIPEPIPRSHFSQAQQLVQQQSQQQSQAQVRQEVSVNTYSSSELSIYNKHRDWNTTLSPSYHFDQFFVTVSPEAIENTTFDNVPLLNTAEVMGKHPHLAPFAKAFAEIELSANFVAKNFILFEKRQYKAKTAILTHDFKTKASRLILINDADRGYFFHQLGNDRNKQYYENLNKANGEKAFFTKEIALFDYKLGIVQVNHYFDIGLEHYQRKLLISRFMFGEMFFTKQEQEILGKWLKENNPEQMERFFYNHVLYAHKNLKQNYPGSPLHKLFTSLIKEQSKV